MTRRLLASVVALLLVACGTAPGVRTRRAQPTNTPSSTSAFAWRSRPLRTSRDAPSSSPVVRAANRVSDSTTDV